MNGLPAFGFTSLHDAALQLGAVARARGVEVHPLPYSRFSPEDDFTWWLAPTGQNPAFGEGKLVIERPSAASDGGVLIGFHVEKGAGPAAAPLFEETARGRRQITENDWLWHAFARGMGSGAVERDLLAAQVAAGSLPVRLIVVASPATPPKLESDDRVRVDAEVAWYAAAGRRLERLGGERIDRLRPLAEEETAASLGGKLLSLENPDWHWLEVLIGIPFARASSPRLSATEVWDRACAPWLRWVR